MRLTDNEMWKAVVDCDKDYDGQFLYGVKAVGVYCRPSCKSKTPLRENIQYFETEEDAQKAGFIPCKRCRPDLMNYDPAFEIARKTKELIDGYYRERKLLTEKMKQFGVTPSHLSIIFKQRYGMPPIQYVNQLRIEQVKLMLMESDMPIIDIACDIGFDSLSAFYSFFKKRTGKTPREYRTRPQN